MIIINARNGDDDKACIGIGNTLARKQLFVNGESVSAPSRYTKDWRK